MSDINSKKSTFKKLSTSKVRNHDLDVILEKQESCAYENINESSKNLPNIISQQFEEEKLEDLKSNGSPKRTIDNNLSMNNNQKHSQSEEENEYHEY